MEVLAPISVGELIDKYSILLIKEELIKDEEKLIHIRTERESVEKILPKFNPLYLTMLIDINKKIWEDQDEFRLNPTMEKCISIIEDNDRRFRVKNKINTASKLKEQKSYPKKKAIFCGHTEAGDTITNIGIVRYLSTCFDELNILVKKEFYRLATELYKDDLSIKVHIREEFDKEHPIYFQYDHNKRFIEKYENMGYKVFTCLLLRDSASSSKRDFYDVFYRNCNIEPIYRFRYNYIPRNLERENALMNIHIKAKPFAFGHTDRNFDTNLFCYNAYSNTEDFLLDFSLMIEEADELYLNDRAFLCLANYLNLKAKKIIVYKYHGYYDLLGYINPKYKNIIQII